MGSVSVLVAVLLGALILFWVFVGGEWNETGQREPVLSDDDLRRAREVSTVMRRWFRSTEAWRAEQVGPGVSRCPTDPENEHTYGA